MTGDAFCHARARLCRSPATCLNIKVPRSSQSRHCPWACFVGQQSTKAVTTRLYLQMEIQADHFYICVVRTLFRPRPPSNRPRDCGTRLTGGAPESPMAAKYYAQYDIGNVCSHRPAKYGRPLSHLRARHPGRGAGARGPPGIGPPTKGTDGSHVVYITVCDYPPWGLATRGRGATGTGACVVLHGHITQEMHARSAAHLLAA